MLQISSDIAPPIAIEEILRFQFSQNETRYVIDLVMRQKLRR